MKGLAVIVEAHRAVHALGLLVGEALGITQAEALVLMLLQPQGSAALEDIHTTFLHRRSTLTNVLDRLARQGYVDRVVDPADNRRYQIQLTASGKKKAAQVVQQFERVLSSAAVGERELGVTQRVLAKVVDACVETTRSNPSK